MNSKSGPVRSPCQGICQLDENNLCIACMRSGHEISNWGAFSDDEKREVWVKIREREKALNPLLAQFHAQSHEPL